MIAKPDVRRVTLHADQTGAAYVEFLMAFIPLFILFLGMVQMALAYAADLVVQHAATTACRAAIVVLDDDPQYYDGSQRLSVRESGGGGSADPASAVLGLIGGGGASPGGGGGGGGGARMSAIRSAASIPLMAISPSMNQLTGRASIGTAIGSPASRAATGALAYNRSAMAVTFPQSPRSGSYVQSFSQGQNVTARVTYLFHCGVPLVSRMMCESYPSLKLGPAAGAVDSIMQQLSDGTISRDAAMERINRIEQSQQRHEDAQQAMQELDNASAGDMMYMTWATGSRFKVLRGEATMPVQSAAYTYSSF